MESDWSCCPSAEPNTSNCKINCSFGFLLFAVEARKGEKEGQRTGRSQFGFAGKLIHQLHSLACCAPNKQRAGLSQAALLLLRALPEGFLLLLLTLPSGPINPFL